MARGRQATTTSKKERTRRAMARRRRQDRVDEARRLRRLTAGDGIRLLADLNESLLRIRGKPR